MMKMDDGFGNGTIRACSIKPILPWAWFAPPPIPEAFPINPTPFNLHKRFLTGGFLQTAVSDAPRTTPASTCHSLWGASGFLLPMKPMCVVYIKTHKHLLWHSRYVKTPAKSRVALVFGWGCWKRSV